MISTVQCSGCGAAVVSDDSHCVHCGARVSTVCSSCGASVAVDARFCSQCGTPSASIGVTPDSDRRQLTVLFCDLVGSTELGTLLDPEDMRDVIRAFQNTCISVIQTFDGFLAKFMGDGILAYFGYPQAHEDDAERAVRAGLRLVTMAARLQTPAGVPLKTRVGIATGVIVLSDLIGRGIALDRPVFGDPPNLASRLKDLAEPNVVVVADSTRRLLGETFEFRNLGRFRLKGYANPVVAWRVAGEGLTISRFGAAHLRDLTAFVGRERERDRLLRCQRLAWAGSGRIVLISGEAGIGKSRIAAWLAHRVAQPHTILRYQCSSYQANSAFHPVLAQLVHAARIRSEDSAERRLDKLERLLAQATTNVSSAMPLIAALLSIPDAGRFPALALSSAQQRRRTLEVLLEQLEGLARRQPVLILFEDIQWADASTLELLDLVIDRISRLRVLLIATSRTEIEWARVGKRHVIHLRLEHLDQEESRDLVRRMCGARSLPDDAIEQIVARTDGIPLFIEEVTKVILESSDIGDGRNWNGGNRARKLAVPATLRDSLAARLDLLAPVKSIAQTAAIIGRDVSYELLRSIARTEDASLGAALRQLEDAGLLFRRGTPPQLTYRFSHALVQEAAYESLLKSQRVLLHSRTAEALRDTFPSIADGTPELVAYHFTQAGLPELAIEWWYRAGERALQRSAFVEAISHLGNALAQSDSLPEVLAARMQRLRVQVAYGQALTSGRGSAAPETIDAFIHARELIASIDDTSERFSIYYGLWAGSNTRGESVPMRQMADAFMQEAKQRQGAPELGVAHRILGTTCALVGDLLGARENLERALALYEPERDRRFADRFGQDLRVAAELNLAIVLWPLGDVERACSLADLAVAHAMESGHVPTLAFAYGHMCGFQAMRRDPIRAAPHAASLVALGRQHGMQWWLVSGIFFRGWTRWHAGDREGGAAEIRQAMVLCRQHGVTSFPYHLEILLAETEEAEGQVESALARVDSFLIQSRRTGGRSLEPELLRYRGNLLAKCGPANAGAAEAQFLEAIRCARSLKAPSYELRATLGLARLYRSSNRSSEVRELLTPVVLGFGKCPEFPEVEQARWMLETLA